MSNGHGYPRPQLVRGPWVSLNGAWDFALDRDAERPERVSFDRQIIVPFAPETPASGIEVPTVNRCWYRRSFRVEAPRDDASIQLHFGAVDRIARVWVNGELAAEHEGGYTGFSCDVTAQASGGELDVVYTVPEPGTLALAAFALLPPVIRRGVLRLRRGKRPEEAAHAA